jgi:hypothetical protein
LTKIINPAAARAVAEFDDTSSGIYKGVFVANDISYHGVLTVNFGNDSQYNAILEYGDDERIGFIPVNKGSVSVCKVIEFRGRNAGFTLNVSDYNRPVVSDGYIDGQKAQAKLLKETSTNRVNAALGTFSDDLDPAFNGTWDLLSMTLGVITISGFQLPVNIIDEVVIVRSGSAIMFTDNMMENFTPGAACSILLPTLPSGPQEPFFTGLIDLLSIVLDEYAVVTQTSTFAEEEATWSLIYSKAAGNKYYDQDCTETPLGGTWSWKGRSGHILVN